MARRIHVVPIEPIESRYTGHWFKYLPKQLERYGFEVSNIPASAPDVEPTKGAFLNFTDTVMWKAEQVQLIANLFKSKAIQEGDVFLVTDAWNPTAHLIRYMSDLVGPKVKVVGIWHAGSYDQADILGQKFDKHWSLAEEKALTELYDLNVFATEFHRKMWAKRLTAQERPSVVCGFPMEYYDYDNVLPVITEEEMKEKLDIVVFPHRKSPEKHYETFEALRVVTQAKNPEVQFVVAQDFCRNKTEYHKLLKVSKIMFSANLQETLGIGTYEALRAGCKLILPKRLSYEEMYNESKPVVNFYPGEFFAFMPSAYSSSSYSPNSYWNESLNAVSERILLTLPAKINYETFTHVERSTFHKYFTGYALYGHLQAL